MNIILRCGDCLEILPTLPDASVDAVVTDPPFNVGMNYGEGQNDAMETNEYLAWVEAWVKECQRISAQQWIVTPTKWLREYWNMMPAAHLVTIPMKAGYAIRAGWTIKKSHLLVNGKVSGNPWDLWEGIRQRGEGYFFRENTYGHPGYTPLALTQRAVMTSQAKSILDPFAGTGTTGVACINAGCDFVGIEKNSDFCATARQRLDAEAAKYRQPELII